MSEDDPVDGAAPEEEGIIEEAPSPMEDDYRPVVTYALLWANVLIWLVSAFFTGRGQLLSTLFSGTDVYGHIAVGANNSDLVFRYGEWWRWISASFLHDGLLHLTFNSLALFLYGPVLERALGRGSFLFLYLVSGIGGYLLSSVMSPNAVSVGASASVFGLIGAIWSLLKRRNASDTAKRTIIWIIAFGFIWGLQPGSNIDNWAHGGGLLTGLVLGYLLESLPPSPKVRSGLNVICGLLSFVMLAYGLGNAVVFAWQVFSRVPTPQ